MKVKSNHNLPETPDGSPAAVWVPILGMYIQDGDVIELPDVFGDPDRFDWPATDWEILDIGPIGKAKAQRVEDDAKKVDPAKAEAAALAKIEAAHTKARLAQQAELLAAQLSPIGDK